MCSVLGLLTPEFKDSLKTVEDTALFTRSVNGANILRMWSKEMSRINADGCGVIFKDELLGSVDEVLKQALFFADLSAAVRVILRELPMVKNVAQRKKKAEDFQKQNKKNAWGESLNGALAALVNGKLPEGFEVEEQTDGTQ